MKLDECNILKKEIEYGELGIDNNPGYEIIVSVNSNYIHHYISAHPNSRLMYEIPKEAKYFSCKIALNDSSDINSLANFEIKIDGQTNFHSKHLPKNKIEPVEIFLDNNKTIELICEYEGSNICHALWIEPNVSTEVPKNSICTFNTTLIDNSCFLSKKFDYCVTSYFDENNFKYFECLVNQIKKFSSIDCKFVIFCEEWIFKYSDFLKEHDIHVISFKDKTKVEIAEKKTGFLNKSVLYSVAKYINSDKYLLIDADIICTNDIKILFDQVINESTLYVTRDAHTEGLSFGDIITEPWSAYKGTPKCKEILRLTPNEINDDFIMNSGVIAGQRKALLGFNSCLRNILPLSEFYFNENKLVGLREQAVANLATIKYNDFEILHKKFNLQVLWEEVILDCFKDQLSSISQDFSPLFVHFNGPAAKQDLKNICLSLFKQEDFKYEKKKFGRHLNTFLKSEEIKILDFQTNETIIESFMRSTDRQFYIKKLTADKKVTYKKDFIQETRLEDLYHEMKKTISKESFDVAILSNLDSMHNIYTKLSMSLKCSKYICFNEYDYGAVKISDILNYFNSGEANLIEEYEENINQKIYILEKSWN